MKLLHDPTKTLEGIEKIVGVSHRSLVRVNAEEKIRSPGYGGGEKRFAQIRRRDFLLRALRNTRVPFSRIVDRVVRREGLLEEDRPSAKVALGRIKREEGIQRPQFRATKKDRAKAIEEFKRRIKSKKKIDLIEASRALNMPIYFVRNVFLEQTRLYAKDMIEADKMDVYELQEKTRLPLEEIEKLRDGIWRRKGWI